VVGRVLIGVRGVGLIPWIISSGRFFTAIKLGIFFDRINRINMIEETYPLRESIQLEVFSFQFLAASFTIHNSPFKG
jgi:hypothetical protein